MLPNQPVSRASDFIFRGVFDRCARAEFGRFDQPYRMSPRSPPPSTDPSPSTDPPVLYIDLPDDDRDESRRVVRLVNIATAVANVLSREARAACEREHEQLAVELGLDRPRPGFQPRS